MTINLSQLDGAVYDAVIVGAGMVGASTALGLHDLGLKVLMIDAFEFASNLPDYTPSYDERSTALSWGTRDILSQLDVWHEVEKHACPITQVHVSEKGRFGTTRINSDDYSQDALGYVVPNKWLGRCLLEAVRQKNIPFLSGVTVKSIDTKLDEEERVHSLELRHSSSDCQIVQSKLLVIADGTESKTAALIGIDYEVDHYNQHALVVNVSTAIDHLGVAYERFTQKGPLAMLPLMEKTCALVWTHDSSEIDKFLTMSEGEFCTELEEAFSERLGPIEKCGERVSYPLRLVKAKEQCRQGVILLGNAAHSLHPVAGQGFNLAIRGVAAFLEYVKECRKRWPQYGFSRKPSPTL